MRISIAQFKSTAARLIAATKNSDVIILPELWSTGYYPAPVENQ